MNKIQKMTLAGLFIALGIALPFLTAQVQFLGSAFLPMHLPVLICGIVCGKRYGFVVGLVLPTLRFLLFGMPPLFPVGIAMTFELATYGFVIGFAYEKLPKKQIFTYLALILSMLVGRVVWGLVMSLIAFISDVPFSISIFIAGAFVNAIPGIIFQIIVIPIIIKTLRDSGHIE